MEKQPLLIIMGAGYLGGVLGEAALRRGWRVNGLTRNAERAAQLREAGFEKVAIAELDGSEWWTSFTEVPDYVVNVVSSAGGGLPGYEKSYVGGNRSILKWVRQHPQCEDFLGSRFLYTSSSGVYPNTDGGWVGEADLAENPEGRAEVLHHAEKVVYQQMAGYFNRWFILRLAGLYGPGRAFLIRQLREGHGKITGRGDHYLNLIRVEDAVEAILASLLARHPLGNCIWNVADGCPAKKKEIINWLGEKMGYAPPYFMEENGRADGRNWRQGHSRRVAIHSIKNALGWAPQFRNYKEGFGQLLTSGAGSSDS